MDNFLYCFDSNYNKQGFCSIISLLNNSQSTKDIYIIHQDPDSFNKFSKIIIEHKNLNNLNIYKFNEKKISFPNLENKHVSEATYYRLFMNKYLPKDIDYIFYIDADAFFIKDYEEKMKNEKLKLKQSTHIVSALTSQRDSHHLRLNLKHPRYLNAGIMLINYEKWLETKASESLLKILHEPNIELEFWDQDVLNIYFNGEYEELDTSLNYNVYGDQQKSKEVLITINEQATIVHYSGKHKPWSPKGIFSIESKIYTEIYRTLFNEKYHIVNVWSYNTLKVILKNLLNLNIFKLEYPLSYLSISLKSILKKN